MIPYLEIILRVINIIAYGALVWVLWPVLSALVAALNAIAHLFH